MKMQLYQAITNGNTPELQIAFAKEVLRKGAKWVQFRFKQQSNDVLLETGTIIQKLCCNYQATFIVNDHVWLTEQLDADGVHLGLQDNSVENARDVLGYNKIIGGTANTLDDVLQRVNEKVDYIGLGPFRFTITKEKLSPILGLNGFELIIDVLKSRDIPTPVFAIGGIELNDVQSLLNIGVRGIAASGLWQSIKSIDDFNY